MSEEIKWIEIKNIYSFAIVKIPKGFEYNETNYSKKDHTIHIRIKKAFPK